MNQGAKTVKAILSEKGQVTIPKVVRERLGLKPGTAIDFCAEEGKLIGTKIDPLPDKVLAVTGIIKAIDVDQYLAELRGPAK